VSEIDSSGRTIWLAMSPCQTAGNSSRLGGVWNRGQGRKRFSRSFLPLFQTCTAKGQPAGGKPTKENKHETSKLNSHSDGDCLHWAFAKSAGSDPAAAGAIPTSPLLRGSTPFRFSP
jgi:hypothetical protein